MMGDPDERRRIINAAYRCLTASNGATVSVTDILAEAELSTRAFYRHFASKDDLLMAMYRRDSDRVTKEMDKVVASATDPTDALCKFIHGMLALSSEKRRRGRVLVMMSEEVHRARGYPAERSRTRAAQEATLARILRQGLADGSFPFAGPDADARSIRAILTVAVDDQMSGNVTVSAVTAADQIVDFALRALGATGIPHRAC